MTNLFSRTLNTDGVAGTSAFGTLERFAAGVLSPSGTYTDCTITLTPAAGSGPMTFDAFWIGHAALTGDAFDFIGDQVQVKFGGSTSVTLTAGGADVTSDLIHFAIDPTKVVIISYSGGAGAARNVRRLTGAGVTGCDLYFRNGGGTGDAGTTDKTGYTLVASDLDVISKIDAFNFVAMSVAFADDSSLSTIFAPSLSAQLSDDSTMTAQMFTAFVLTANFADDSQLTETMVVTPAPAPVVACVTIVGV